MQISTLNQVKSGTKKVIHSVKTGDLFLAEKLSSLGIVKGTTIEVMQAAPFGDPIKIRILGSLLALRLSEAESIEVADI